jgi:hypothetical protein
VLVQVETQEAKCVADLAGGFEYRGRSFRFEQATCSLGPGELTVEAIGQRCGLSLVCIPFPGAASFSDLPGRVWDPDEDELARCADTFAEGGMEVGRRELWIQDCRIECKRYDPEQGVLVVFFQLAVEDGETGREDEAEGVMYCRT